jgi:hypothetical protein
MIVRRLKRLEIGIEIVIGIEIEIGIEIVGCWFTQHPLFSRKYHFAYLKSMRIHIKHKRYLS